MNWSYTAACIFAVVFSLVLVYFGRSLNRKLLLFSLGYFAAAISAITADDICSALLAFEFLAIFGVLMIALNGNIKAAVGYGTVNFLSGALILAAISQQGFDMLHINSWNNSVSKTLLLIGIVIHCGMMPVCMFFIDAYSRCSNIAAVFLQLFSTKAALIVLYKLSINQEILLYLSFGTVIYSVFWIFLETDIRRLIVYNTIGQIGLIGVGIYFGGNILPYLVSSILYQTVLYIFVFEITQNSTISNLLKNNKSFYIKSSFFWFLLLVVTLSMSAFPPVITFASKAIILQNVKGFSSWFFVFSSFIFVVAVPLRLFHTCFFKKTAKSVKISLSTIKKSVLLLICACLFYPLSFEHYDVVHITLQVVYVCITAVFWYFFREKIYNITPISINTLSLLVKLFSKTTLVAGKLIYDNCFLAIKNASKFLVLLHSKVIHITSLEDTCIISVSAVAVLIIAAFFL